MAARFFLGTHQPHWLSRVAVPLFISRRRLIGRRTFPRALSPWALDSGGYSELSMHGSWSVGPAQYVDEVRMLTEECGRLEWAAIQDWMCEPWILNRTGFTVQEHQQRTINSYVDLMSRAPDLPWTPVLQGWEDADYYRHADQYAARGVMLSACAVVGIGSVCRRQHTDGVEAIIRNITHTGIKLHGFGFKIRGLSRVADALVSADSMAWSFAARRSPPLPGHQHKNCANCLEYALMWRQKILKTLDNADA